MSFFKKFFKTRFWDSWQKVVLLILFTFIPLILNIIIAVIPAGDRLSALFSKIIPGEMLAYCLSFIAPLFLLLLNSHGSSFKIPALKFAFVTAFIIYLLAMVLMIIAKNALIRGIDFNSGHRDLYFWLAIISLVFAIFLRLYTAYQDSRFSDYKQSQNRQQQNFNNDFQKRIDQ
jgi:hypothetical protein